MKEITAYAVVVRKFEIKGKNEREVLGARHILYSGENLTQTDCSCSYTEEVYNIFKTKREAERMAIPYPYRQSEVEIKKVKITVCK